jgi:hypothetical protein
MRLAILVAYLFDKSFQPLINLHLSQITRYTNVKHTIYGSVHGLDGSGLNLLRSQPNLTLVGEEVSGAKDRRDDHNYRLEMLAKRAFDDGATHFVTLHLDSFPIATGWAQEIVSRMKPQDCFASITPFCFNACLLWDRDWQARDVPLLVDEDLRATSAFEDFSTKHPNLDLYDGGIGFFYRAYSLGKTWTSLLPTGQNIWGDLIFHLVGTTRLLARDEAPKAIPGWLIGVKEAVRPALRWLPSAAKASLYRHTRRQFIDWETETERDGSPASKKRQLQALLKDPDGFISRCRSGVVVD